MFAWCPWANVVYGQDEKFWKTYLPKIKASGFAGELVAPAPYHEDVRRVIFNHGANSGAGAMNLAEHWGAQRIILLGYDAQHTDGRKHCHADHPAGLGNAGSAHLWPAQFRALASTHRRARIVNCSRMTALDCFPRGRLEDELAGREQLVVYTAVLGRTDPLHEPKKLEGARFVCFTDQDIRSKRWEIVRVEASGTPTRQARKLKLTPHRLFPDADATLWMDACFTLRTSPAQLLGMYGQEFICFRHRDRTRIHEEAAAIARIGKARILATYRQLAAYQSEGFDTGDNPMRELSCNGVLLRRNTPKANALNDLWLDQIERHTLRDQMSLDYCAWKLGLQLSRWPGTHADNPHFVYTHYNRPVNDY